MIKSPDILLRILLRLIGLHSFIVGCALITQPAFLMKLAEFGPEYERFFPTQGGVFHIVMAVCYVMASLDLRKHYSMIVFSIAVKMIATFFLLIYYFVIDPKWIVLVSGLGDGMMAVMIYAALRYYLNFLESPDLQDGEDCPNG